ncbi:MAG: hypothetical protein FWD13_05415 [Treponema sp.]|nr:hypothetical protein [Treponema sp.]
MKNTAITNQISSQRKTLKTTGFMPLIALLVFFGLSPLYAQTTSQTTSGRGPIDINLIIDGSDSLTGIKDEVTAWVSRRLDQILVEGDRVTVWNAGSTANVIFTGSIDSNAEKDNVKRSIRELTPSGNNADFSSALREAASRQGSPYSYTLLISASPGALSSVLSGPQANLLRFSRIEEFSNWRALVIGLNLDSRVRRAASDFFTR